MAEFSIRIAGFTSRVTSLFDSTRDYCRKYLTEETPQWDIMLTREDLAFEQEALRQEALEEGLRVRIFTDPFLERTAIQRKVAEYLFDRDILMTHGSTVAVDGKAYLFTAKCGTGKSTHTRLWRQVFGQRAVMITDDKPFLQLTDTGVCAFGSPWSGKHGLDTNISAPLAGICILQRGPENIIRPLSPEDALPRLHKEAYIPMDAEKYPKFQTLVEKLARQVPLWHMTCTKDPQAAQVAFDAMSTR